MNSPHFAFLATYAHKLSANGAPQHLPLHRALRNFENDKSTLLRLLSPLHKASLQSPFLKSKLDAGEIYEPQAWSAKETHGFLKDIPVFQNAGIVVNVPNWWKPKAPPRPMVNLKIGEKNPVTLGFDALLDFSVTLEIGGEILTQSEIKELLSQSDHLIFFKGQWVEVEADKLKLILAQWRDAEKLVKKEGMTFSQGLRLLSGLQKDTGAVEQAVTSDYIKRTPGTWLRETLESIDPFQQDEKIHFTLKEILKATLRPYQSKGVNWLSRLNNLRIGAVLADDMGLGKTIQIISLLLLKKGLSTLLIVPASLLTNWKSEIEKFAPSLTFVIAHSSGAGYQKPDVLDVLITTYGAVQKIEWVKEKTWDLIVLDEAQAIKNPGSNQTISVKKLKALHKLVLTGTPIENRLGDLWSLL